MSDSSSTASRASRRSLGLLSWRVCLCAVSAVAAAATVGQYAWSDSLTVVERPLPFEHEPSPPIRTLNSTLGFQEIVVVHSEALENRRDELSMMAAVSGLSLTFDQRRDARDFPPNRTLAGLPWHAPHLTGQHLADYRSQASVWRRMIEQGIRTALIISDTVDWDVNVHDQLERLQVPLASLVHSIQFYHSDDTTDVLPSPSRLDPFSSQSWDILFLGCETEEAPSIAADHLHVRYQDPSVAASTVTSEAFVQLLNKIGINLPWEMNVPGGTYDILRDGEDGHGDRRRIIAQAQAPECSSAYALSNRGAARLLHHISRGLEKPPSAMITDLVRERRLRAYIAIPSLFGAWSQDPDDKMRNPSAGRSNNVRDSVRQNLKRLIWET